MTLPTVSREFKLMTMAVVCALLVVFGHLILAKSFSDYFWLEYTAASIPFLMLALCLAAIRIAAKPDDD